MAETLANSAASTLNGAIDSIVTSLTVVNGTVFPSTGNFRIIVESEIMICTSRATHVLTVQRGQEGTAAASHANGVAVTHVLTAGGLLAYTQDPTHLGTGTPTSAKFLRGDAVATWQLVPNLLGVQMFTSSGTYTPTSGTTKIYIECIGGGGGGGGAGATTGDQAAGGGGGGGGYAAKLITSGFSGVSYAVGAAGAAGAAGVNTGGTGGDTTFNSTVVVAKGGAGGTGGTAGGAQGAGGAGGATTGATGDVKFAGQDGSNGRGQNAVGGGAGGGSHVGGGAPPNIFTAASPTKQAGVAATVYGGGGSGAINSNAQTATAGGAGAVGLIRIWEFA